MVLLKLLSCPHRFRRVFLAPRLSSSFVDSVLSVIQGEKRINYEAAIALLPASSATQLHKNIFLRMRSGDTLQPAASPDFAHLLASKSMHQCPSNLPKFNTPCPFQSGLRCNYIAGQCCCPLTNATCTSVRTSDTITCDNTTLKWAYGLASAYRCPDCNATTPRPGCPSTFLGNATLPCLEGVNCNYEVGACCCPLGSINQGKTCSTTLVEQDQACSNGTWKAISGIEKCAPCPTQI